MTPALAALLKECEVAVTRHDNDQGADDELSDFADTTLPLLVAIVREMDADRETTRDRMVAPGSNAAKRMSDCDARIDALARGGERDVSDVKPLTENEEREKGDERP